jgi:hypothetical protein
MNGKDAFRLVLVVNDPIPRLREGDVEDSVLRIRDEGGEVGADEDDRILRHVGGGLAGEGDGMELDLTARDGGGGGLLSRLRAVAPR